MSPSGLEERLAPLLTRRSASPVGSEPPSTVEVDLILRAATTVPDHGRLRPWRLVVIAGGARAAFGRALAAAGAEARPDLAPEALARLHDKAFVAPTAIAVVARIDTAASIPAWEQVASAACVGYAITLAAHQLGLAAMWKSSPYTDGAELRDVLDLAPSDQFLGWVNLGRPDVVPAAQPRLGVDLTEIARVLTPEGRPVPYGA